MLGRDHISKEELRTHLPGRREQVTLASDSFRTLVMVIDTYGCLEELNTRHAFWLEFNDGHIETYLTLNEAYQNWDTYRNKIVSQNMARLSPPA